MTHPRPVTSALVLLALALAGCAPGSPGSGEEPGRHGEAEASASPAASAAVDPLVEREEFQRAQGLPLDGSPLVAVTDAQKDFVSQQRAYVESQGGMWSAQAESLSLALAADACETSILNAHDIDEARFAGHVQTSPLFAQLIPAELGGEQRRAAEGNVASIMIFGTRFLCPADAPQWEAAFTATYG